MKLTGEQRRTMHRALLEAFPTRSDLAMMLSSSSNVRLESIAAPSRTLSETVFELLVWAESHGSLEQLLTNVVAANPGNAALAEVTKRLGLGSVPASSASPSAVHDTSRGRTASPQTVAGTPASATARRTYCIKESALSVEFGDIVSTTAEVIVSSDDYYLSMGGGVSRAILEAGGQTIALEAAKAAPATAGDVVVTGAGQLPARHVFHAVTIGPDLTPSDAPAILSRIIPRCFQLVDALAVRSIAFPALGTGVARFNLDEVAALMANLIVDQLQTRTSRLEVTIYLKDRFNQRGPTDYLAFFEEFAARAPRVAAAAVAATATRRSQESSPAPVLATTAEQVRAQRLHQIYALLAQVHERRYQLEMALIERMNAVPPSGTAELEGLLEQNEQLKRRFLAELDELNRADKQTAQVPAARVRSVFVSSTFSDLQVHRTAVKDQITKQGLLFKGMELFGADPDKTPAQLIVDEVRAADAFVGLVGARYGFIDGASGLSMTELEFNAARAAGKPMLLYLMADEASVPFKDIEQSVEGKTKLDGFRARLMREHTVAKFITPDDLAAKVFADLSKV